MKTKTIIFLILFIIIFSFVNNNYLTKPEYFPALIIVYDDGHKEDITKALPIHQKYGVPAVSAVYTSAIGSGYSLNQEDLLRLQANGWEIASHGKYHSALIYNSITEKINAGDKAIKLNHSNLVEEKHTYYIYNTKQHYGEKIKFSHTVHKSENLYHVLSDEINNFYPEKSTLIKLTKEAMKEEIVGSKLVLEEMGLNVNSFVYPYNGIIEPASKIVKKYYDFGRGGGRASLNFPNNFINQIPLTVNKLKGVSFDKSDLEKDILDQLLKEAADKKVLLIFYGHTGNDSFSTERLEYLIKKAQRLDYNITTFNELSGK